MSSSKPVVVPYGSVEDYVLTDIKPVAIANGVGDPTGRVFSLQQVDQDRLRQLNGKRVGVTGRIEDKPDLPKLDAVSIVEITGSCPATPTPPTRS
jgi:hypothetical protein